MGCSLSCLTPQGMTDIGDAHPARRVQIAHDMPSKKWPDQVRPPTLEGGSRFLDQAPQGLFCPNLRKPVMEKGAQLLGTVLFMGE